MAESIELGRFKKTKKETDSEEVVVTRGTYAKNPEHLDIRCYYDANKGADVPDMRPGKSGVRMDITSVPHLLRAISKLYEEGFSEEIDRLLEKYNIK